MATGAARFTRRITETQQQAFLTAVLIEGRTVTDAIEMAKTGKLNVPAFEIGRYAYQLVSKNREAFEASNEDALEHAGDNELRMAEVDALAHLRAIRAAMKRDGTDNPTRLRDATQALTAIRKARRDAETSTKPRNSKAQGASPSQAEAQKDDPLSNLLTLAGKETKQGARTG